MKQYQVYFFSRTGNSERIATQLAKRLACPLYRISDDVDWRGFGAYLKFQAYAKGKKQLDIVCDGDPAEADEIIVVAPIWAERLAPTALKFLSAIPRDKVHIVSTAMMSHLSGAEGYKSVTEIIASKKNEAAALDELASRLTAND